MLYSSDELLNKAITSRRPARKIKRYRDSVYRYLVSNKILALILFSFALCLLIALLVFNSINQDNAGYAERIINARADRVSDYINSIEAITYQFYMNRMLNRLLLDYVTSTETYDISSWNTVFSSFMEGMAQTIPEIEDAIFFDLDNLQRHPLTMTDSLTRTVWKAVKDRVEPTAEYANGKPVWTYLNLSSPENTHYIICARLVKEVTTGRHLGLLTLLLNPEHLANIVSDGYWNEDSNLPKSDISVLVNENGEIFVGITPRLIGQPAKDVVPGYKMPWSHGEKQSGHYIDYQSILSRPKRSYFVVWRILDQKPWQIFIVLPYSIGYSRTIIIIISTVLAAISIIVMSLMMFTNPRFDPKVQKNDALVETDISMLSRSAKKNESLSMHKDMTILKLLSQREKYLLAAVAKGRSNKQIAYDLKLSEQTVKNYLSHIYRKIGVSDRVEAACFALQNGLIDECPQSISNKNNKNS